MLPTSYPASPHPSDTQQQQQQQQQAPPPAFRNPFLPYEEELWVQHLSDSHTLLLNKFNVVPHHVLVVTRQYELQQDPLNSRDLAATQQVMNAMDFSVVSWGCACGNAQSIQGSAGLGRSCT
jgi:ATP adenylyltransferase/5',5'''-P-1,P-4-tetraphosphate phosphorylase II